MAKFDDSKIQLFSYYVYFKKTKRNFKKTKRNLFLINPIIDFQVLLSKKCYLITRNCFIIIDLILIINSDIFKLWWNIYLFIIIFWRKKYLNSLI